MIRSDIAQEILNGFCRNKVPDGEIKIAKSNTYLGLLTALPKKDEQPYEDGSYFKEPEDPSYQRIQLNTENPFEQLGYISSAEEGDPIEIKPGVWSTPVFITNPAYIMFPESTVSWGEVVGFGIFDEESGTSFPFIWGPITATDGESSVEIASEEVPIIRAGSFKISLY